MKFPFNFLPLPRPRLFSSLPAVGRIGRRTKEDLASSEDLFEGIKTKIDKKSGFKDWLKEIKKRLETTEGHVWLGGDRPFPHNPTFMPQPPITDALRTRLFHLNQADPAQWTPRRLSAQFKVAIPRIKMVLKMKAIEAKQVAEGRLKLDPEHVGRMEALLGSKTPIKMELEPIQDNSISQHLRPMFVAIPETSPPLTFEVYHISIYLYINYIHIRMLLNF